MKEILTNPAVVGLIGVLIGAFIPEVGRLITAWYQNKAHERDNEVATAKIVWEAAIVDHKHQTDLLLKSGGQVTIYPASLHIAYYHRLFQLLKNAPTSSEVEKAFAELSEEQKVLIKAFIARKAEENREAIENMKI